MSKSPRRSFVFRSLASAINVFFIFSCLSPVNSYAQTTADLGLPAAGVMLELSPLHKPLVIKGLTVHPKNPLLFDFIFDAGDSGLKADDAKLKAEAQKLVKYFLASLTVPEQDQWVNLSPYEKDRTIPVSLGETEMGRDMLSQDYVLKQLTASLIYPEKQLGQDFWNKVYAKARELYGTSEVPVNTFNKVWVVADRADVIVRNNTAFVVNAHLKVMLEEDYDALRKNGQKAESPKGISSEKDMHNVGSQIVREIVLPELEKEVNGGKHFANLRQIFYSMILSTWYKKSLKEALLNQVYANKAKLGGIDLEDKTIKEQIYQQYLAAYKKGVFNYIKEDMAEGKLEPKKYFSGGVAPNLGIANVLSARSVTAVGDDLGGDLIRGRVLAQRRASDSAMTSAVLRTLNDATAALEGEIASGAGAIFILGTGANGAMKDENGKTVKLFELGHNLYRDINFKWKVAQEEAIEGRKYQKKEGERSFEDVFKGSAIAQRFVKSKKAADLLSISDARIQFPIGITDVFHLINVTSASFSDEDKNNQELQKEAVKAVLVAITNLVNAKDQKTIDFVNELGRDMGFAFASLFALDINAGWTTNFVLVSGVGEKFAKPNDAGTDYFMEAVHKGLRQGLALTKRKGDRKHDERVEQIIKGLRRSVMGWEREVLAARFTDDDKKRMDVKGKLAGGVSLGGTKIGVGLLDEEGRIVENSLVEEAWDAQDASSLEAFVDKIASLLRKAAAQAGVSVKDIIKLGVSFAGSVDENENLVGALFVNPNLPKFLNKVSLAEMVVQRLAVDAAMTSEISVLRGPIYADAMLNSKMYRTGVMEHGWQLFLRAVESKGFILEIVLNHQTGKKNNVPSFNLGMDQPIARDRMKAIEEFLVTRLQGQDLFKFNPEDLVAGVIQASNQSDITMSALRKAKAFMDLRKSRNLAGDIKTVDFAPKGFEGSVFVVPASSPAANVLRLIEGGAEQYGIVKQVVHEGERLVLFEPEVLAQIEELFLSGDSAMLAVGSSMKLARGDSKTFVLGGNRFEVSVADDNVVSATVTVNARGSYLVDASNKYESKNILVRADTEGVSVSNLADDPMEVNDAAMTVKEVKLKNLKNDGQHEGIALEVNGSVALIDPEIGTIQSLVVNGKETYVPGKGNPPMAFWTSRLPNGKAQFMGRSVDFKTNPLIRWFKEKHALHGLLGHSTAQDTVKWTVEDKGVDANGAFVKLSIDTTLPEYQLLNNDVFGKVKVSIIYRFDGSFIATEWVVENKDDKIIPWSGGFHPFMDLGDRNEWSVRARANQYWQVNDDRIPELKSAQNIVTDSLQDFRQWVSLDQLKETIEVPLTGLTPDQDGVVAEFRNDRTGEIRRFYQDNNQPNAMLWVPVGVAGLENTVSWQSIPGAPSALYLDENGIKGNGLVKIEPKAIWRAASRMEFVERKNVEPVVNVMPATNQMGDVEALLKNVRQGKAFNYTARVKGLAKQYLQGVDVLNVLNQVKEEFGKGNEYLAQQFLDALWLTARWGLDETFMRELILKYMVVDKIDTSKLSSSSREVLQSNIKDIEKDAGLLWDRWLYLSGKTFRPEVTLRSIEQGFSNEGATRVIRRKIARLLGDGVDIQIGARSGPRGHTRAFIKDVKNESFAPQFYARSMFTSQGAKGVELLTYLIDLGVLQLASPEVLRLRKELNGFKEKIAEMLGQEFLDTWQEMPTVPVELLNEALKPNVISNIHHINHFTLTFDIIDAVKDHAMTSYKVEEDDTWESIARAYMRAVKPEITGSEVDKWAGRYGRLIAWRNGERTLQSDLRVGETILLDNIPDAAMAVSEPLRVTTALLRSNPTGNFESQREMVLPQGFQVFLKNDDNQAWRIINPKNGEYTAEFQHGSANPWEPLKKKQYGIKIRKEGSNLVILNTHMAADETEPRSRVIETGFGLYDETMDVNRVDRGYKEPGEAPLRYTISKADKAMTANVKPEDTVGGIDLNAQRLNMAVSGEEIDIQFDPAMIEQFKRGDFSGITPVIINFTPVPSIRPLLGLKEESDVKLAKA